jgi:hypothetical protein
VTPIYKSETFDDFRTPPLIKNNETSLVDSGFTGHFLLSNAPFLNKKVTSNPLTVIFPNGQTMESTHTAFLDIPEFSKAASAAHICPAMENNSLLSVGQLYDEGYSTLFSISEFTIMDSKQNTLMKGSRDSNTGVWRINVCQKKVQTICSTATTQNQISAANIFYELCNTGSLVNYLHNAMCSCTKSGHLATWPGVTEDTINKYLKLTPATTMGHMNQKRQNIQSTKKKVKSESESEDITHQG